MLPVTSQSKLWRSGKDMRVSFVRPGFESQSSCPLLFYFTLSGRDVAQVARDLASW
jgi:hypothetical protein